MPALHAGNGWVAETAHFRVIARDGQGLDATAVATAAADLEAIRRGFHLAGLGYPRRADGRLEVLLVPGRTDLHALLRDPPTSRTRGITVRGLDRDYSVVPWLEVPGPRVTLAHEYAHQLDPPGWPPWFSEGRAIYLARRTEPRSGASTVGGLAAMLDGVPWTGWSEVIDAERDSPATHDELFQVKSWLLVHWLASQLPGPSALSPERAARILSGADSKDLAAELERHLAEWREPQPDWLVPLSATQAGSAARAAASWEIPLLEAEVWLALQRTDLAEPVLAELQATFPGVARVQAAYAALRLVQGQLDRATRHFGLALRLGDTRVRTAYRYAILLMRPGASPPTRAGDALRHALVARDRMPHIPVHHLAVVHGRMLKEDWGRAFGDLRALLQFPEWRERADREASEIRRRIVQSLRAVREPSMEPAVPRVRIQSPPPEELAAWVERPYRQPRTGGKRIWPPHGTWLVHGRIAGVRCSDGQKVVILHSPYQRLVLRVNPDEPPELINRPFRGKTLPCNSRGWVAAIAYRKIRGQGDVSGEVVGIRF